MTTSQYFYGPAGQVAGNDIHNYGVDELSNLSKDQLLVGLIHCRERLADVRRRLFINPVVAWLFAAAIVTAVMVFTGNVFSHSTVFWVVLLFGLVVPRFFYIPITRKYGPMVHAYREAIVRIEFVLHSRG